MLWINIQVMMIKIDLIQQHLFLSNVNPPIWIILVLQVLGPIKHCHMQKVILYGVLCTNTVAHQKKKKKLNNREKKRNKMGKRRFEPNEKDFSILKKTSLNLRKMKFKLSVLNEVKYDIIAILYLKLKTKSKHSLRTNSNNIHHNMFTHCFNSFGFLDLTFSM